MGAGDCALVGSAEAGCAEGVSLSCGAEGAGVIVVEGSAVHFALDI